ncbi:MAG TPA: protein kinase, partial [Candidatus Acidoferrum sp.]|nr:protein kinase [Candidatus Acidoferrum sp.]
MKYCDTCRSNFPNDFTTCPKDQSALRFSSELIEGMVIRDKYQILRRIGAGGMATVYEAKHLAFNEIRALKVVNSRLAEDEAFLKRFRSEAVVTRKLQHPNAVRVDDFDTTEDGRPYIVMEYVEGKDLRHAIEE